MNHSTDDNANVACQITAPGRGAIASIWLRGPLVRPTLELFFRPKSGRPLAEFPCQRIVYGDWLHATIPEDVVVVVLDDQSAEIHVHGGSQSSQLILQQLRGQGFSAVDSRTAMRLSHPNPWQVAALEAVQYSLTPRAADRTLLNADGRLARQIDDIRGLLTDPRRDAESLARLEELRRSFEFGERLVHGWRIAIAGKPNVGKSTLINRLVGFARSIVFDEPGTTRDVVRHMTAIGGWPVELCDTAGLHRSTDPTEQLGIQAAEAIIRSADLTLWVGDVSQPWSDDDQRAIDTIAPLLLIHNKSDLAPGGEARRPRGLLVSLRCDPTVDAILTAVEERLFSQLPPENSPFLVQPWQAAALDRAMEFLRRGDRRSAEKILESPGVDFPKQPAVGASPIGE